MSNQVEDEVERVLAHQMDKGVRKYGHGLVLNDGHDWLAEAIEECVDQLQYLVAAKLERDKRMSTFCEQMSNYVDTNGKLKFTIDDTRPPEPHELRGLD